MKELTDIKEIKYTPAQLENLLKKCELLSAEINETVEIFKGVMIDCNTLKKHGVDVSSFDKVLEEFRSWVMERESFVNF
jgi:predicted methyltransferase